MRLRPYGIRSLAVPGDTLEWACPCDERTLKRYFAGTFGEAAGESDAGTPSPPPSAPITPIGDDAYPLAYEYVSPPSAPSLQPSAAAPGSIEAR